MKLVIQRVLNASVTVDDTVIGAIGKGFLVLIGVTEGDTEEIADKSDFNYFPTNNPRVVPKGTTRGILYAK